MIIVTQGKCWSFSKDDRLFIKAILYRYRTGIPWHVLPERFTMIDSNGKVQINPIETV